MSLDTRKHFFLASLAIAVVCLLPNLAAAQQATYYTFDSVSTAGANAAGGYTYTCANPPATNPILCFNGSTDGSGVNPRLSTDQCDSGDTRCPYSAGGSHTTIQMTPATTGQRASMWFSIPQKVLNGFTSYFAFRLTPCSTSACGNAGITADGITFAVQNAAGTVGSASGEVGSGPTVIGGTGGSIGYGGIDNSLVTELDTYLNSNYGDPNLNHMAVQSCGSAPNLPIHGSAAGSCQVGSGINSSLPVTMADGHIHEVVVEYSGETSSPANLFQVYIDPQFVSGTHTPCPGPDSVSCTGAAQPVISVTYDIGAHLNLLNPASLPIPDSAYVGFTAATGADFETQEILAWTFTPHSTSTQQQPVNNPGTPTTFPFGAHTYAVNYPPSQPPSPPTNTVDMVVVANAISPAGVSGLLIGSSFAGSACQQYDSTGGKCIVYSVNCVTHGTTGPAVPCPATADPLIAVKAAFDSDPSIVPVTPGFLQGDPLYSQISSIQVNSGVATVTCSGECAVHDGETVSIINATPADYDATNVTVSDSTTNIYTFNFTYAFPPHDAYVGGAAVTSNNLQNICNASTDTPPCWQAAKIDGTISGRTKNFSDFVALFSTVTTTVATISAPTTITYGQTAPITVSVTPAAATGTVSLTVGDNPALTQSLSGGSTTFDVTGLAAGPYNLSASYPAQGIYGTASATGTLTVNQATPTINVTSVSVVYDGNPHPAAGSVTGVGGAILGTPVITYNPGVSPAPVNAGTYQVLASFAATTDYLAASNNTGSVVISKFTPTVKVTGGTFVYDGNPHPATGSVTGVGGASLGAPVITYSPGGSSAPVSPGTYGVLASFAGSLNYNSASARTSIVIGSALGLTSYNLNFGNVDLGARSNQSFIVTNVSKVSLKITNIYFNYGPGSGTDYGYFTQCGGTLKVGQSCSIRVELHAQDLGAGSAILGIAYNLPGSPALVNLSGTVINPRAGLNEEELNFGTKKVGSSSTQTLILSSTGDTPLLINSVTVSGSSDFTTSSCPASLAVNTSCTITVTFKPSAKQSRSGTVIITDNASSSPQTVSLSGRGD